MLVVELLVVVVEGMSEIVVVEAGVNIEEVLVLVEILVTVVVVMQWLL